MPKYRFTPVVYASFNVIEIEADNKEEALEKSQGLYESECLCWHCSNIVELGDEPIFDEQYLEEIEE